MFEGLDQKDWNSLGHHVYGKNEKIPDAIRNLLSQDPDVRDEAREFLLGGGQDFGYIYDTTHHIIPFVLEILSSPDGPGKENSLNHLSSVARHIWDSENLSVRMMRLHIKTYDSLKAGLHTFVFLLDADSIAVRLATIDLLQYLTDEVEILIPEFMNHFHGERTEDVQIALLRGLKLLLSSLDWTRSDLKEQCEPFLNEIIESHSSQKVQTAGAQTAAEIFEKHTRNKRSLSPRVELLLSDEFLRISTAIDYKGWSEEFDQAIMIIKDLFKMDAIDSLLEMLPDPQITPVQAHLIARGLLAIFMMYAGDAYWKCRRNYDVQDKELNYLHSYPLSQNLEIFLKQREHFESRIRLLKAIVETQRFWEAPTNMFSFFVGLPDSREELNAILNSKSTP